MALASADDLNDDKKVKAETVRTLGSDIAGKLAPETLKSNDIAVRPPRDFRALAQWALQLLKIEELAVRYPHGHRLDLILHRGLMREDGGVAHLMSPRPPSSCKVDATDEATAEQAASSSVQAPASDVDDEQQPATNEQQPATKKQKTAAVALEGSGLEPSNGITSLEPTDQRMETEPTVRIHTYTHTYIHTYTHTRIHAYTHTHIIHAYTHTRIHA